MVGVLVMRDERVVVLVERQENIVGFFLCLVLSCVVI